MWSRTILALSVAILAAPMAWGQAPPTTQCTTQALAGGTADAITIPNLPCVPTTTTLILTPLANNQTAAPTITLPGGTPIPVVRFDNRPMAVGDLVAQGKQTLVSNGQKWFLLNPGTGIPQGAFTHLNISPADQSLSISPTGNPLTSLASLNVQGNSASTTTREYLANIGFNVNTGMGGILTGQNDKVGLYVGVVGGTGGVGNLWAENPLLTIQADARTQGHDQVSEMDLNNNKVAVNANEGPTGIFFPPPANPVGGQYSAYGLIMESSGTHDGTSAIDIGGANQWRRGVGCDQTGPGAVPGPVGTSGVIENECFYDYSNSPVVLAVWTGNHTDVIDVSNAGTISGAIVNAVNVAMTPSQFIYRTASGDGRAVLGGDPMGNVVLGSTSVSGIHPYVDFHSSGVAGYDARIASVGTNQLAVTFNNGVVGPGSFSVFGAIINSGMPTSCSGQPSGTFWNSSGTVHVC